MKPQRPILVIGGGIAGLTAAYYVSRAGHKVVLLERAPILGGRIRSVRPTPESAPIDWGQHLIIGAYQETLRLASLLGSRNRIHTITGPTPFLEESNTVHRYRISPLPAPFHALPGMIALGQLSLRERLMLAKAAFGAKYELQKHPSVLDTMTAREWLVTHSQGERAIDRFWEPLIVSTLNTPSTEASAYLFAVVLARGIFSSPEQARGMLPETTLASVLVEPAVEAINASGGTILTGRRACRLLIDHSHIRGAVDDTGTLHEADVIILAVPPWNIPHFARDIPELSPLVASVSHFTPSPIISVDLWFDRHWLPYHMASPLGGRFHWFFSHPSREPLGFRVSLVLSAADAMMKEPPEHIISFANEDIRRFFPEAPAVATHHFIIRDPRATFRAKPGLEQVRPLPNTPISGLFLAGDWTATSLPATIEGAVLSGRRAAEAACAWLLKTNQSEEW